MRHFSAQRLKNSSRMALRVTAHAVTRFRERVEEELSYWSDDDLVVLLNERIRDAALSREIVDPREPSVPTMLHLFESRTGKRFVAVVREKCVVTVLDAWMAQNNYPGWEDRPLGILTSASPGLNAKGPPLAIVPAPGAASKELSGNTPDMYLALTTECRVLGQQLRALREQRSEMDSKIEEVLKAYGEKRARLLALMDEGSPT